MRDRDEQRKFENDVFYEVWRRGGDPDRIDYDKLSDCYYEHHEAETCARRILQAQQPKHVEQEQFQEENPEYEW